MSELLLWYFLGSAYLTLEGIWRGWTHISMFVVGGICGLLVGAVNQFPVFYRLPVIVQSLIGAVIVMCVEFMSGCVINLWWGWGVWDYTGQFGNILGQVCLPYGLLWLLLMPFAIWLEDTFKWMIYSNDIQRGFIRVQRPEHDRYTLNDIYCEFFTGR